MTLSPIQTQINQSIEQISAVADLFPGVVLINRISDGSVAWMSERGCKTLNCCLDEITNLTADEYHSRYFNGEDAKDYLPKLIGFFERNIDDEICTFFQQVRFSKTGGWNWHMTSIKILLRDEENRPILGITMSMPIDAMHHMAAKAERLLEENNFLRKNLHKFSLLSEREREILGLLALGKSASETSKILFIAQSTVETHRKNIKQKLGTSSYYELCEYGRAFDLV